MSTEERVPHGAIPIFVTAASLDVLTDQIDRLQKDLDRTRRYSNQKEDEGYVYRRALEQILRTFDERLEPALRKTIEEALADRGRSLGS